MGSELRDFVSVGSFDKVRVMSLEKETERERELLSVADTEGVRDSDRSLEALNEADNVIVSDKDTDVEELSDTVVDFDGVSVFDKLRTRLCVGPGDNESDNESDVVGESVGVPLLADSDAVADSDTVPEALGV